MPAAPDLRPLEGYALALAIPLAALGLEVVWRQLFELTPFLLFCIAPPVVAWAAGGGPGTVAVLLSSLLGALFLGASPDPAHQKGAVAAALAFLPGGAILAAMGWLVREGFRERERSSRAHAESERLYRTLFELAPYGVALMSPDGRFVAFNRHAHEELGYTREEFARLTVADIEAVEDPEELRRHIDVIQATGAGDFIGHHRTRSGEVRETWVQVRTVRIGEEELQLTTWRDETEERRARRELERSERRFRALIEKSSDMISLLDVTGRIRFWSPSTTDALGWTAEEMIGRDVREHLHPDDVARVGAAIAAVAAVPGSSRRETIRVRHRDASWRTVESVARNLLDDPAVEGIVVNSRDATDQRRLEEQLAESQKLESVGRLAGGVAHDFNNLLTVVLCSTETMRDDLARGRQVDAEDVESIAGAGERARDLTRQLLAFARRQIVAPTVLDLNDVVLGSEKLLRRVLGEDVVLSIRLQPGVWKVRCDEAQLEQVIMNLAVNARDAMPDGGHLLVDTANVQVRDPGQVPGLPAGDWVRLTVRDSGGGMAPEVKAHVFEPFFTTKPKGQGTGLGLSTVYGIVRQNGGHIRVESDPAHGTTFDVFLPRGSGIPVAAERPAVHVERSAGTVLLVEDDGAVREVAARALREAGYRVLAASGAGEAMELAARAPGPVDVLVTDVVMPGVNGKALADDLRRRRPDIKVLFVSGYTDDIIGRHGVLEPGVQFLPKPFTGSALAAKVTEVLGGA
ncbi:MAG: PAS domain S-box protein [Anaeromyxobacteraceae bacterium]